jgi:hypothetical protein
MRGGGQLRRTLLKRSKQVMRRPARRGSTVLRGDAPAEGRLGVCACRRPPVQAQPTLGVQAVACWCWPLWCPGLRRTLRLRSRRDDRRGVSSGHDLVEIRCLDYCEPGYRDIRPHADDLFEPVQREFNEADLVALTFAIVSSAAGIGWQSLPRRRWDLPAASRSTYLMPKNPWRETVWMRRFPEEELWEPSLLVRPLVEAIDGHGVHDD